MPASFVTVALFFVYTWGMGFSIGRLVKERDGFLERNIIRVGFGLSAFVVLGIILNTLDFPLDYRIFLLASVAGPLYVLFFRNGYRQVRVQKVSLKLTVSNVVIAAAVVIFLASLFMYVSGAFKYPYLEDDDPWGHATAAKYVSIEKTAFDSPYLNFQYMDPYPPGYDMTFGILHQSSQSVYWTLKFFNALLISLSVLFFFFFAKEFLGSRAKALFATFVLASVPAYLSHFIWAPVLAMAVFSQSMYALEMIKHDKRWWIVAAVCFASLLLSHPTHAVNLSGFVVIFVFVKLISSGRAAWLKGNISYFLALVGGALLSLFWWAFNLKSFANMAKGGLRSGTDAALQQIESSPNILAKLWRIITHVFNAEGGTATRAYAFKDFVVAQGQNLINNPVGFGVVVSALVLAGVLSVFAGVSKSLPKKWLFVAGSVVVSFGIVSATVGLGALQLFLALVLGGFVASVAAVFFGSQDDKPRLSVLAIVMGWLLFAFLGVNSVTFNLPVGLFAFRFWMILALPVALIAAEGFFALLGLLGQLKLDKATLTALKLLFILVVVAGVLFTSAKQKYDVNTAQWPPGAFWSVATDQGGNIVAHELQSYLWLSTLPVDTKVFTFSNADQVIGFDKFACGWCKADYDMKQRFTNNTVTAASLYTFLKDNGYEYFVIGGLEAKRYGFNATVGLINDAASSGLFNMTTQPTEAQQAFIFKRG